MVIVDNLDEWLDLASLGLTCLGHTAGDLGGVALNAGDQCVWVWVRLVSSVLGLDDHDLSFCLVMDFKLLLPPLSALNA